MTGREFTGRTPAEAVAAGLRALGLREEDARVEVLDEGARGFLGLGARDARVTITAAPSPAEVAGAWLREVLDAAGIRAEVRVRVEEGVVLAEVAGAELGALIGSRGRTLDALQYLLNIAVGKRARGHQHVVLDIAGYRKKREELLCRIARNAAEQVRRTGRRVVLEPMPPAERRLVHLALKEMRDLCTQSEGEEPYRRVVVGVRQEQGSRQ